MLNELDLPLQKELRKNDENMFLDKTTTTKHNNNKTKKQILAQPRIEARTAVWSATSRPPRHLQERVYWSQAI